MTRDGLVVKVSRDIYGEHDSLRLLLNPDEKARAIVDDLRAMEEGELEPVTSFDGVTTKPGQMIVALSPSYWPQVSAWTQRLVIELRASDLQLGAEQDETPKCPPVMAILFGSDAEHATKGDWLSVEGPLEASIREHQGRSVVGLSVMARWLRLTGHAGQRKQRSVKAKEAHEKRDEPPPFDDEILF